jgi:hypothetical protein
MAAYDDIKVGTVIGHKNAGLRQFIAIRAIDPFQENTCQVNGETTPDPFQKHYCPQLFGVKKEYEKRIQDQKNQDEDECEPYLPNCS